LQDLRAKSDEDLAKEFGEAHRQLFTVRLQLSTRQLTNVSEARTARRRIARIKTIQRERELEAAYGAVKE
jgi:large subunit ribosomal protein L29